MNQCTTVGFHDSKLRSSMDFGEVQDLKVCVLYEETITLEEVVDLEKVWAEELSLYKINLIFTKKISTKRRGFWGGEVLDTLMPIKMEKDCDRFLYLVGRESTDIFFELGMIGLMLVTGVKIEIQGAVETHTNTRGYIKAKYISLLQLLFTSPESTLVHEGYHMLGCPHALWKDECYTIIQATKKRNQLNDSSDKVFSVKNLSERYPQVFTTKEEVDSRLDSKKKFSD